MFSNTKYGIRKDNAKKCFVGTYSRIGAKLSHTTEPDIRFIVGTRLNPTETKPKHFLLYFEGKNKPNIYFSSLYPTIDPNVFNMEHEGVRYSLTLDSDKAFVLVLNQSQQAA